MAISNKPTVKTGALRAKAGLLRAASGEGTGAGPRLRAKASAAAESAPFGHGRYALATGGPAGTSIAHVADPAAVYRLGAADRIRLLKAGVRISHVEALAARMNMSSDILIDMLRLPRRTLQRKGRAIESLTQDQSERILGVEAMIGQVQVMVEESGDATAFDAASWLGSWLQRHVPALGDRPAAYMDSIEGQKLVGRILAMSQSGAYA